MGLVRQINNTAKDLMVFGPGFVIKTAVGRIFSKEYSVTIPKIGDLHLRSANSDLNTLRQIFRDAEYDIESSQKTFARLFDRYRAILAAGRRPIVVDAGANIGASALYFDKVFPEAAIVSIEPDSQNCAMLRKNIGNRPNHVVLEAAVGAERGFVQLSSDTLGWAVQTERAEKGLPIVTIEDAFAASGGDDPLFVKIDIEGFENDLFSSNTGWIERTFAIAIEPHDWMMPGKFTSGPFQKAMAAHDFEMIIKGENLIYVHV